MSCCPTYRPQELVIEAADYLESLVGTNGCSTYRLASAIEGARPTVTSTGLIQFSTLSLRPELSGLGTAASPLRFTSGTALSDDYVYAYDFATDSFVLRPRSVDTFQSYSISDTSIVDAFFGDDGTGEVESYAKPFQTIQAALDAVSTRTSSATQTCIINSGTYTEELTITPVTRGINSNGFTLLIGNMNILVEGHPLYIRNMRITGKVIIDAFRIVIFSNCHFTSSSETFAELGTRACVYFDNCIFQHDTDVPIVTFTSDATAGLPMQAVFSGCKVVSNFQVTSYIADGPASVTNVSLVVLSPLYSDWQGTGVNNLAGLDTKPATLISATGLVVSPTELWT